jgi:hypothetical protein
MTMPGDLLKRNLLQSWRHQGRKPSFCIVVVATLALGIGVNTVIVEDVKYNPLEQGLGFETYVCYRQIPIPQMQAVVRVQRAIVHVRTLESLASETLWQRRLWGLLMSIFAGLALLLACVGLYSVMSCVVSLRTREIGIRMALGAPRVTVLALITGHGMLMALAGVGIGLAVAVAVGRVMRGLLFGVGGSDPAILFAVPMVLLLVALFACAFPSIRAARLDPQAVLREQ